LSTKNTSQAEPKPKLKRGQTPSTADPSQNSPNQTLAKAPDTPQIFDRYYHMFASGELAETIRGAATDLGLHIGSLADETAADGTKIDTRRGLEIVQTGWERSNYYVELRCWETPRCN